MSKPDYDIKITNLLPDQAMQIWPVLEGYFEKACIFNYGRLDIHDVWKAVREGSMMVHLIWNPETKEMFAAVASEAVRYPKKSVFMLSMAGGAEIEKWAHLWPAFKEIGRQLGFDQIEVSGRAGWKKYLPGAKEIGRTFIQELQDGEQDSDS